MSLEVSSHSENKSGDHWLNSAISISVALAGTFLALCNVKDGNIVQAMQEAQSNRVDKWSYYQAKSTKQHLAEGSLEQMRALLLLGANMSAENRAELDRKIAEFESKVAKYEKEKSEIRAEAEQCESQYNELNKVDDQFDLSEAAISVGIALAGVSALVEKRSLFWVSLTFLGLGTIMGLAGFLGWAIQIPLLSRLLS